MNASSPRGRHTAQPSWRGPKPHSGHTRYQHPYGFQQPPSLAQPPNYPPPYAYSVHPAQRPKGTDTEHPASPRSLTKNLIRHLVRLWAERRAQS